MLPGETRQSAVERAYDDGWTLTIGDDGTPVMIPNGGDERDTTYVSRNDHQWMLDALGIMQKMQPGWTLVSEHQEPGRRWPWAQSFSHPTASMFFEVDTQAATFKWVQGTDDDDITWRFWWRVLKRFAAYPCAIFHPDEYELIATSLSATQASDRYRWF